MVATKEAEIRKGQWSEQEDLQLVRFVGLFGERRWDFLAKVSGLNRTGKSCRLRWVNYLHPGLKRGRMTPQEEQLVLQLHALHGNRWSQIARSLPGRTDNEIKNYWRTHMRKKAQERKRSSSPSSSGSTTSSSNECESSSNRGEGEGEGEIKVYPMDQLWNEIAATETVTELSSCNISCPSMPSPMWDYPSLWGMDEEEYKIAY
ncbi:transcription factor MYB59-like [Typha latifolia]|uniref:transcription factor MYB59-like n=1 Tax=Typha latifolia TaxID=4733 RepID=UPI003C2F40FB